MGSRANSTSVSRKLSSNHTTHAHHHGHGHVVDTRPAFAKGPFSYSIEKDIDRYLQYKKDKNAGTGSTLTTISTSGTGSTSNTVTDDDAILELHEDLMHSLIDSTNSRLHSTCTALKGKEGETGGSTLGELPLYFVCFIATLMEVTCRYRPALSHLCCIATI